MQNNQVSYYRFRVLFVCTIIVPACILVTDLFSPIVAWSYPLCIGVFWWPIEWIIWLSLVPMLWMSSRIFRQQGRYGRSSLMLFSVFLAIFYVPLGPFWLTMDFLSTHWSASNSAKLLCACGVEGVYFLLILLSIISATSLLHGFLRSRIGSTATSVFRYAVFGAVFILCARRLWRVCMDFSIAQNGSIPKFVIENGSWYILLEISLWIIIISILGSLLRKLALPQLFCSRCGYSRATSPACPECGIEWNG